MSIEIVMPRLSDSMEEGTIVTWLKAVGDRVAVGDPLVEIETDKANMVYEADTAGFLVEILADADKTVAVGAVIAYVGDPAESREPAPAVASSSGDAAGAAAVKASPLAKRLAREHDLDISAVAGSGPGGRIGREDVEAALAEKRPDEAPPKGPPASTDRGEVEIVELTKLQATVAKRMAESKSTVPHFQLSTDVDMTECVAARRRLKEAAGAGEHVPSLNDMVVKAAALALGEHPRANASYRDGSWQLYSRVNVGVAVAGPDALVVPTIFDADRKSLAEIGSQARALAERVRAGTITPPELAGGTFTVSNLGMFGISRFEAVVNPPQAGILAVGSVLERPVMRDEEIVAASQMTLTLGCDHRILYGADGARFLATIRSHLEHPVELISPR